LAKTGRRFGRPVATSWALREWVAENPQSKSRCVIARFALKNAVKEDESLQEIYEAQTLG